VVRLAVLLGVCGALVVGCGSAKNARKVSQSDYNSTWPLTVSSGTLRCQGADEVTFTVGGTTYAVNGLAHGVASQHGWEDVRRIWADDPHDPSLKISIGPLIDDGLKLCSD
jgi:hypothetical protein